MSDNPQNVYLVRRAIVLVALLAVVALVVWGINAIAGGGNQSAETTATEIEAETETEVEIPEISDCIPGTVEVTALIGYADAETSASFAASETPHMWYEVRNNSGVDCLFNVGSRVTFFTIRSGDEIIWESKQCDRSMDTDQELTLEAGKLLRSEPAAWMKVRSSETGCGEGQADVVTGGASYHLKAELNGVLSDNPQQFLLF